MMMSHDDDRVPISSIISAFCSSSCAQRPAGDRAVCSLFRVAVHIFSSKIKPQCFNFPCKPFYFSFYSIYRRWRFLEADCGSVYCLWLLCESPPCPVFSSCRSLRVLMRLRFSVSLQSCPAVCIWLCFAWHKHAHFWILSTLPHHVSINTSDAIKDKKVTHTFLSFFCLAMAAGRFIGQ